MLVLTRSSLAGSRAEKFLATKSPGLTIVSVGEKRIGPMGMDTNDVGSVNVVGYYKIPMPSNGGMILCGMTLAAIDATNQNLNGIFGTQLRSGVIASLADVVMLRETNETFSSYSRKTSDGLYHTPQNWSGNSTNPPLDVGQGFWLQSKPGATGMDVVVMGEVIDVLTTNMNIHQGYQLLSYPFSTDISLHSWGLTNGRAVTAYADSDHILTWNSSNSTYSVYVLRPGGVWTSMTAGASYFLNIYEGFWYYAQTNFVWVETNSYYGNL